MKSMLVQRTVCIVRFTFTKLQKATIVFIVPVRLFTQIKSACTGRFTKFYTRVFFENLSR